ncbi:hypothetical protein BDV95DRAFT_503872 [Massariosphaeria phaeospora]|uniref:Phospholipid/glycerol acyltransferase domain-containing protein n=1 Tax=Massariosphaeria phaeospora TaxID=100035 RepID=A0A7C8I3B1_9PLEO|nr:hypothetical protein BDV95DRAFT_503872 [Massariosphaeria phaeospora]
MAPKKKEVGRMNKYVYDAFLWVFSILVELFFREVHPRSSWKIPKEGPVIFVCAPHANQFVDPLILMRVVRKESRRRIHILIAEKSMKRKFVGSMAGLTGAVPVGRAMDKTKPAAGKIYLPDPINDPCLIRGIDTNFEAADFQPGGTLVLPKVNDTSASAEVQEIKGPEELRLKRPFKGGIAMQQLTGRNDMTEAGKFVDGAAAKSGTAPGFEGISFKVAPKLDQSDVYDAVHNVLHRGGSVGIFPEGGSHDRTDLLPLKAGVAVMALGTVAEQHDCGLKIIPVGMNYFHAHKFRSRAVIEFGNAIDVPAELAQKFTAGGPGRREAIGELLETVRQGLDTVTVTTPDYDTLMLIQAVRRLYNPKGTKLPLPRIVELNRRLIKGYAHYKDDPRIVQLKKEVIAYNKRLLALNIRDHQVQYAKKNIIEVFFAFWYRLIKLCTLLIFVLPGTGLFSLVFVATKVISRKKAREALAASTVKVQARDVMATWKLLVALAVAPLAYTWYIVIFTYWYSHNGIQGYLPRGIPLSLFVLVQAIILPSTTYAALRFGESAMDIFKSLLPLIRMMTPSSNNELVKLQKRREELSDAVNDIINTLGPELYPDFHNHRIITDPFSHSPSATPGSKGDEAAQLEAGNAVSTYDLPASPTSSDHDHDHHLLSRSESFHDITNMELFSTRPSTPKKSRSRTASHANLGGFQLKPFSKIDGKEALDEVSKRVGSKMRSRNVSRRQSVGTHEYDSDESAPGTPTTPRSESGDEAWLTMAKKGR